MQIIIIKLILTLQMRLKEINNNYMNIICLTELKKEDKHQYFLIRYFT